MDRDGIPHFTGSHPHLMKEYRKRVLFAYHNFEGSGDDETKQAADLKKKQSRFAKRLMDALHGEAWRACEDLMAEPEKLREKDGFKHIFKALQSIEKVGVIRKTEAFDQFFEKCYPRKGQSIDSYLRQRKKDWDDLLDLAEGVQMSEDLRAYFLLKNINLGKDERRSILLANQSSYNMEGIEKALRVSYYDIHEKEKHAREVAPSFRKTGSKGYGRRSYAHHVTEEADEVPSDDEGEEEDYADLAEEDFAFAADDDVADELSDVGASQDSEIYDAYTAMDGRRKGYKESRKKLKDLQKQRGFQKKEDSSSQDRKNFIAKEKLKSRCAACGRIGHWAGDSECTASRGKNTARKGTGRSTSSSTSPAQGRGGGGKGKAYLVGEQPMFFSLDKDLLDDGYCNMVRENANDEPMDQDSGSSELDGKRKIVKAMSDVSGSGWEYVSPPKAMAGGYVANSPEVPWPTERPATGGSADSVQMTMPIKKDKIHIKDAPAAKDVIP